MKRNIVLLILDAIFFIIGILLAILIKPTDFAQYLSDNWQPALIFLGIWIISSVIFSKYKVRKFATIEKALYKILKSNLLTIMMITTIIFAAGMQYSRLTVIYTVIFTTILELIFNYFFMLDKALTKESKAIEEYLSDKPKTIESLKSGEEELRPDLKESIVNEVGEKAFNFFEKHIKHNYSKTLFVSTTTRFNIDNQPDNKYHNIVNLKRINDIQRINKFFESINRKLPEGGLVFDFAETYMLRKKRILKKFPPGINWVYYTLDFLIKRVAPKLIITKWIYFFITSGNNRVISKAETLGRLYSCGFEIVDEELIDGYLYFVARKVKEPAYDYNPTYGPLIKLRRYGKGGKIIGVYKMRTMHPYSEYLQAYVFEQNKLADGGKFKDDFRITTLGKFMRKVWIDELPMFLNVFKGEMKLVGVRPISKHYYGLFSDELKEKRIKYKPGLIPPFYADLPKTLEEIEDSELRYLESYSKNPASTQIKYFNKSMYNIFIKKARSN